MFVSSISPFRALDFGSALSIRGVRRSATEPVAVEKGSSLRDLARKVLDLRQGLDRLRDSARLAKKGSSRGAAASTTSASSLGLSIAVTFTTRGSTEEINTVPTSYSQREPVFSGGSTSSALIEGVYDGGLGDDVLTIRARNRGTIGDDNVTFQVLDGAGRNLGSVQFRKTDPIGEPKALTNGLTLSLSAGDIDRHDTLTLDVFQTVGSVVEVDNPFNGIGNSDPLLDPGQSVTAGSFEINGETIDVLAGDTLNGVLQRISASAAGVLATFDSATETVLLTQKTPGAEAITLGNDTSGFLAAAKLDGSTEVLGTDIDLRRNIVQVAGLSGIRSGDFLINGERFLVNVAVDSLQDLFDRVNNSSAGVNMAFDPATNRVSVTATSPGGGLELDSGSSRLFEALDLVDGRIEPAVARKGRQVFAERDSLKKRLDQFGENLQELFEASFGGLAAGSAQAATSRIKSGVRESFSTLLDREVSDRLRSGLGIDFFFDDIEEGLLRIDDRTLDQALTDKTSKLAEFLLGRSNRTERDGLLDAFDAALDRVSKDLRQQLDRGVDAGLRVDLLA